MTLIVAAVACSAGLAACETGNPLERLGLNRDGLRCDLPNAGDRVHIEIRYAKDGRPSAVPDVCTVEPKTTITWRSTADSKTPFELRFPDGGPAGVSERTEVRSSNVDENQKLVLVAGDEEGRYKYDIVANGIVVDPAIIIER
ncbi:MAG: hypothetical protein M3Q42_03715 [Pseudomonadota bacterium]|nr:hypothetical protein [Pseudomonadota bacterium]